MNRAVGSPDVFCNGMPVSRQGDVNTPHVQPGNPCPPCVAPISSGSATVFINSMGCGRVGDALSGCTAVAQGSADTFAGG
jgi:uncharacterized Zn-binding protein involved in type VI secretion